MSFRINTVTHRIVASRNKTRDMKYILTCFKIPGLVILNNGRRYRDDSDIKLRLRSAYADLYIKSADTPVSAVINVIKKLKRRL